MPSLDSLARLASVDHPVAVGGASVVRAEWTGDDYRVWLSPLNIEPDLVLVNCPRNLGRPELADIVKEATA